MKHSLRGKDGRFIPESRVKTKTNYSAALSEAAKTEKLISLGGNAYGIPAYIIRKHTTEDQSNWPFADRNDPGVPTVDRQDVPRETPRIQLRNGIASFALDAAEKKMELEMQEKIKTDPVTAYESLMSGSIASNFLDRLNKDHDRIINAYNIDNQNMAEDWMQRHTTPAPKDLPLPLFPFFIGVGFGIAATILVYLFLKLI